MAVVEVTTIGFMRVTAAQPRAAVEDAAKASAAELLAVWGNAALTTRPLVAKNPQVMQAGTVVTFTMKRDGDTLTLTTGTSSLGTVGNPVTLRLVRAE